MEKIKNEILNESIYMKEYPSGLRAYVIPKPGYFKTFAIFGTNYGSIDDKFILPETGEIVEIPDGVAHFLEHKLFSMKDGSAMDKFAEMGASSNAYTSFTHTAYLFSCTTGFEKSFKLLLDFVQNPYITEESVENEKGIIGQEIRMYEDDPDWQVYFNFINALYKNFSVKKDIAGTKESISEIDRELLYKCFNTFYSMSNMVIFVAGDVIPESVFEIVEENVPVLKEKKEIKRFYKEEPEEINCTKMEKKCDVSMPLFIYGFKMDPNVRDRAKTEISLNILMEMIAGKSSDLYESLYDEGLLTSQIGTDATLEKEYAFFCFSGESEKPEDVIIRIKEAISKMKKIGIEDEDFERIKKRLTGEYIRQFNSVDKIAHGFMANIFRDVDILDYVGKYSEIKKEDIKDTLDKYFDFNKEAVSIVRAD